MFTGRFVQQTFITSVWHKWLFGAMQVSGEKKNKNSLFWIDFLANVWKQESATLSVKPPLKPWMGPAYKSQLDWNDMGWNFKSITVDITIKLIIYRLTYDESNSRPFHPFAWNLIVANRMRLQLVRGLLSSYTSMCWHPVMTSVLVNIFMTSSLLRLLCESWQLIYAWSSIKHVIYPIMNNMNFYKLDSARPI